jgi:hypothetical protein
LNKYSYGILRLATGRPTVEVDAIVAALQARKLNFQAARLTNLDKVRTR